jgi:predicted nucleic acid-binding protein
MAEFDYPTLEIDRTLTQVVKSIDPNIFNQIKKYFEEKLFYLYENKLELTLIINAEIVISDAIAYVKNNKSYLLNLSKSPFLKLFAPVWLKQELEKKIPEISKKEKIDENKFRSAILTILEKINLVESMNDRAYKIAFNMIGERDEKDVPYLALYLSIKSHGILTKDKDVSEIQGIKIWSRPGVVGKVVSVFEKGAFSFFIIGKGLPLVFRALYEIFILIIRSIWEIVKLIETAIYTLLKKGIEAISKFPEWIKILIGIGILLLILSDKGREFITNTLQSFAKTIINVLEWFYDAIKNVLNLIAPLIEIGMITLKFLFERVEETIVTYKNL